MEPKVGRFIDPLSDFGFKRLFGSEPNKDILIDFLNELFKGQKEIVDLTYSPTEYAGDGDDLKKAIFDLQCTGKNGEQFIIEMQRAEQLNFKDRVVFYTSRLINEQLPKGSNHWNIELKEVYLIAILEYNFRDSQAGRYLHNVALTDTDTDEVFYNKLGYKFLELPKFAKSEEQLETELDKWFYLLKHMSSLEKVPTVLNKRVFQKIFKIAEISNLTKEERKMYNSGLKAKWDYENTIAFAEEKGVEKGAEIERAKALQEKKEMAKTFKGLGVSNADIAKGTGLSIEEIEKL
jgi:predicted transposase/invertase (TIGR01784 family)